MGLKLKLAMAAGCRRGFFMLSQSLDLNKLSIHNVLERTIFSYSSRLGESILDDILKLSQLIKSHDVITFRHSLNVALFSNWLANEARLPQKEVARITIAGFLHDIGKTNIPTAVLNKPGRLDETEWELIKKHPQGGVFILSGYTWSYDLLSIIGYHHERVDGSGYYGLSGEDIPLGAKIICIADAFDAMFSLRSYQQIKPVPDCCMELEKNSDSQFDGELVNRFIRVTKKVSVFRR